MNPFEVLVLTLGCGCCKHFCTCYCITFSSRAVSLKYSVRVLRHGWCIFFNDSKCWIVLYGIWASSFLQSWQVSAPRFVPLPTTAILFFSPGGIHHTEAYSISEDLVAKFLSFCAELYTHNWYSFHPTCIRLILRSSLFSKLHTMLLLSLVQNPSSRVQISNIQRKSHTAKKVIDYSVECIQKAANGSLHSFIQTLLHFLWAPSESLLQEKLRVFWLSILSKNVVFTIVYRWITTAFL
jgi:hypothetical protein